MERILSKFIKKCEEKDISTFFASINLADRIELEDTDEIIRFCEQANIKIIFLEKFLKANQQNKNAKEVIKEEIKKYYESVKNSILFQLGYQDIVYNYESALETVLTKIDCDLDTDKEQDSCEDEGKIDFIDCCVIYSGKVVFSTLHSSEEDNEGKSEIETIPQLSQYKNILYQNMLNSKKKQEEEREATKKAYEDSVRKELESVIKEKVNLSMKTQKSRKDFADRLHMIWTSEKGHTWLTKTSIRSMVDLQYDRLTGEDNLF